MAIRVKHGMDPGLVFDAAYQAGQGRFEEDRRRFDLGQQLRERQLAEQQRQFNVATDQRQRQFDAARVDRAADRFDQQQRLQLGAALEAQQRAMQSDAYLQREAMRQQGILQEQAMRNDQERYEADLKRRSQEFAIEQGWIERDAEYMNGQVDGVVDQLMEDRDSFDEQGRLAFSKQMQALRQTQQRYAAGYLRPKQYTEALGQWMEGVASERWDTYKKQEPTPEQMYNQGVYEAPDGRTWYFGDSRGVRVEDPLKEDTPEAPKTITNDMPTFYKEYDRAYKSVEGQLKAEQDRAYQAWAAGGGESGPKGQPPELGRVDPAAVARRMQEQQAVFNMLQSGEIPEPAEEAPEVPDGYIDGALIDPMMAGVPMSLRNNSVDAGENAGNPIPIKWGHTTAEELAQYAGQFVVDTDTGRAFRLAFEGGDTPQNPINISDYPPEMTTALLSRLVGKWIINPDTGNLERVKTGA